MKIYVTKFALTGGITEYEASLSKDGYALVTKHTDTDFHQWFAPKEFHTTKEAAIIRAEEMRVAKLKSLEKAIKKFSLMSFD